MTAVRLSLADKRLTVETVKQPTPGPTEVKVRVAYAGVCLTDLHFIEGETPAGMKPVLTLGHEVAGTVDSVGSGVYEFAVGDRVIIWPAGEDSRGQSSVLGVHFDGGWAEYVVVPADRIVSLDADIPLDVAAIIPDAVSTPWAALTSTGNLRASESVAIWGLGGLGYHAVQLARLIGAAPIITLDPLLSARERAIEVGADFAFDPTQPGVEQLIREATDGRGVDAAFDFYGSPAVQQQAFDALRPRGRLVLVGIPAKPFTIESSASLIRGAKQIVGHYGADIEHLRQIMRLVRHGRLDLTRSISAIVPLADARDAVHALQTKSGNPVRILLKP